MLGTELLALIRRYMLCKTCSLARFSSIRPKMRRALELASTLFCPKTSRYFALYEAATDLMRRTARATESTLTICLLLCLQRSKIYILAIPLPKRLSPKKVMRKFKKKRLRGRRESRSCTQTMERSSIGRHKTHIIT